MNRSKYLSLNMVQDVITVTAVNVFTVPLSFTHIFFFSICSIVAGPSHLLDLSLYTRTGSPISSLYLVGGGILESKALRILLLAWIMFISDCTLVSSFIRSCWDGIFLLVTGNSGGWRIPGVMEKNARRTRCIVNSLYIFAMSEFVTNIRVFLLYFFEYAP